MTDRIIEKVDYNMLLEDMFQLDATLTDYFQRAVLFLITEQHNVILMKEIGDVNEDMLDAFCRWKASRTLGEKTSLFQGFRFDLVDVSLEYDTKAGNASVGLMVVDHEVEMSQTGPFLMLARQMISFSLKAKEEAGHKQVFKRDDIEKEMMSLLHETDDMNHLSTFAQQCLALLKSRMVDGDYSFFIFEDIIEQFQLLTSTNEQMIESADDYSIDLEKWEENEKVFESKGYSAISKCHVGKMALFDRQRAPADYALFPVQYDGDIQALFMYSVSTGICNQTYFSDIQKVCDLLSKRLKRLVDFERMYDEHTRKQHLLKVNQNFHSTMNVSAILKQIIFALNEIYPHYDVCLYLSHDWDVSDQLPIHKLRYSMQERDKPSAKAYITGEVQRETDDSGTAVYVPLKGKQGVYGVLQLQVQHVRYIVDGDIHDIQLLADMAGNAIENADLYQQSQKYIAELRLINQTSQQLNSNLKLSEVVRYMKNRMVDSFSAEEVGFIFFDEKDHSEHILEGSSPFFFTKRCQRTLGCVLEYVRTKEEAVFVNDLEEFIPVNEEQEEPLYRSVIAVPMKQNDRLMGVAVVVCQPPNAFTFETFKLFQALVHHSSLAFANSKLHEELENLVVTDYLTKLYTRSYLDEIIDKAMRQDEGGTLILIDVDDFKNINDYYGHQVGDNVLVQVADILKSQIRENMDVAARWGGEEMAIYLRKADEEVAKKVAKRILSSVKEETEPAITISCGVASWSKATDPFLSLKKLFNQADQALYSAKNSGKNQYQMSKPAEK
ncbi:sensor domain-containing diguanylate cyclase [Texcoconibacillus texcoconensis]|uniref:Diguanylate cyclase (GGDEF)-like protein n=1 Tax=Texcoconibacillus texcoconensis TaxID=1095777 RepID=A0A840QN10_9BACI|nr:diguanylate cyclase [Texcoconibacillus texcoconensis]MBB5172764.1 diguanylate cyclase (GGDEF)-like protein [Texcoconibacillus texcoconensis]